MDLDRLTIPDSVWDSAEYIMQQAKHVAINDDALQTTANRVRERFAKGFDSIDDAFGTTNDLEKDINLIYFETAANFCFWSQERENKWMFTNHGVTRGGWYGLRDSFAAALDNDIPVFDADFMSKMTTAIAADIFRGERGIQIPLLEQRVNNIVEAARLLISEYDGSAKKLVAACDHDAAKITKELVIKLPSYRDGAVYGGHWVWFLKRAQIFPNDISQLNNRYPEFNIKNLDRLTIFADYRLPQVLRHYEVLVYSDRLSKLVDKHKLITSGSVEEIEIRAATIAACRKLGSLLPEITIADIDVSLWLLSQDKSTPFAPHHMTVSHYY